MADPCLGCGTATDANGDLTIKGARSGAWKTWYGSNIDAKNGIRCDPITGKLWVPPPAKHDYATFTHGSWIGGVHYDSNTDAYRVNWGTSQTIMGTAIAADYTSSGMSVQTNVAAAGSYTFTNPTDEWVIAKWTMQGLLGVGQLAPGGLNRVRAGFRLSLTGTSGGAQTHDMWADSFQNHVDVAGNSTAPGVVGDTSSFQSRSLFTLVEPSATVTASCVPWARTYVSQNMVYTLHNYLSVTAEYSPYRPFSQNLDA